MQTVIPGLHASAPEGLSFAPSIHVRAFLLQSERGNVLIYSTSATAESAAIEALGGVSRHYLNHWHEVAIGDGEGNGRLGAPLFCHEDDRKEVSDRVEVAGSFAERHRVDDDLEAIPIPGHTPGATAYLWDSGQHRCLFTGDSLFLRDGEWVVAVLESSDPVAYVESLELIKQLDFDMLVPWAAGGGQPFHAVTVTADAGRRIDAIVERLRNGADR
jgi:glyoxylase-like metal-dependent hydrolase (beta-lactamase superfamily II)